METIETSGWRLVLAELRQTLDDRLGGAWEDIRALEYDPEDFLDDIVELKRFESISCELRPPNRDRWWWGLEITLCGFEEHARPFMIVDWDESDWADDVAHRIYSAIEKVFEADEVLRGIVRVPRRDR